MTHKIESNPQHQHERTDINIKYIAAFAAILVCVTIVLYIVLWGVFNRFAARVAQEQVLAQPVPENNPPLFPSPRLQVDPQQDLEQLRRKQQELLNSYGWVDRDAGVVRIPIERAMDLVGEKGLPDFGKPQEGGVKK